MPADHGTPNTGDERESEVEIVAKALGRYDSPEHWDWREYEEPARTVVEALDAARSPQGEDHEAGIRAAETAFMERWGPGVRLAERLEKAIAAYSRVAPSRDGTVAVEDVVKAARAFVESWWEFDSLPPQDQYNAVADRVQILDEALAELGVSERTERIHDQATKEEG